MGISRITLVVGFVVFLLSSYMIIPDAYAVYSAELYPSQGSVNTEIFLKVRGIGGKLYLYWDGILLGTYTDGFYENLPGFDIYFYPPNEHPLSDLGNHTVFLEFWWKYWDGQYYTVYWNTTLNFEITEYVPCPEYLALNSTYSALLADYSNLNASYSALQAQYNDLTNTYQELLSDYNAKLANYSSLSESYDSLCASYDALETNYNSLQ